MVILAASNVSTASLILTSRSWRIEVATALAFGPSQEDVAGRLHKPETVHHTLSVVRVDALTCIRLQNRGARLLDLQNERISSAGHQQDDPAGGADATDAHDLGCGVLDFVAVEQHAIVRRQGFAVPGEGVLDNRMDLAGRVTLPVKDRRELLFENRRPSRTFYEFREEAFRGALLTRLRQVLNRAAADPGILDTSDQHLDLDGGVPQFQHLHFSELSHAFAVG